VNRWEGVGFVKSHTDIFSSDLSKIAMRHKDTSLCFCGFSERREFGVCCLTPKIEESCLGYEKLTKSLKQKINTQGSEPQQI